MTKILKTIFYSAAIIALTTLLSCKRQPIYSEGSISNSATIKLSIDWTESNLQLSEVSNISIYAYPFDGGSPYLKISGSIDSTYIYLPAGTYSLLLFNDAVEDVLGIRFNDSDSFDNFSANITTLSSTSGLYYDIQDSEVFASTIGRLAVWNQEEFEVTSEMVACNICKNDDTQVVESVVKATPTSITRQCEVVVAIENLNNAQTIQGSLIGFASGVFLSSGTTITNSELTTLYSVNLNSYTFNSDSDGSAEGAITLFGLSDESDATYQIVIDIILGSGELVSYTRDITDQVLAQSGTTIYIDLLDDEDKIVLPQSSGTGFGVDNWGDNQQIELL